MKKIYIVTDLEGVSGVCKFDQVGGEGQKVTDAFNILKSELNSAIDACKESGVAEIVIWNGHGVTGSIKLEDIRSGVKFVIGDVLYPAYGIDKTFDGIMLIGQHPMNGTENGVLEHSFCNGVYTNVYLNGRRIGEAGLLAAIAGYFDVPMIFLSGDTAAVKEAKSIDKNITTVAVKDGFSRTGTITLHPSDAGQLIAENVKKGLALAGKMKPWKLKGPVTIKIEYSTTSPADRNSLVPGVKRTGPKSISYTGKNIIEVAKIFTLLGRIV